MGGSLGIQRADYARGPEEAERARACDRRLPAIATRCGPSLEYNSFFVMLWRLNVCFLDDALITSGKGVDDVTF